ncbi:hypothetical protein JOM56_013248 [Amanita muscaria]
MADIEVDHPQLPVQLGTDSIHNLDGLADDWAEDGTGDIKLTELQHALVDMDQERELFSNWMDMGVDEISPSSLAEQEREFLRHWSDNHFTNLQGNAGDSFGEALLGHEFLETDIPNLEHTLALLDYPIDDLDSNVNRFKPPPKSKRRVRFQCPPDPESDNDAESSNDHRPTDRSEELTWGYDLKEENPYFDPYDQFQSIESDSGNASDSILYGNPDGSEVFEAGAKESRIECFYCNELFMAREPSAVDMTNWNYLCPSCIMRLCERPNHQM